MSAADDITQSLKVVPRYIIGYWAGDYYQALRHINAPAAHMVRQQRSTYTERVISASDVSMKT